MLALDCVAQVRCSVLRLGTGLVISLDVVDFLLDMRREALKCVLCLAEERHRKDIHDKPKVEETMYLTSVFMGW